MVLLASASPQRRMLLKQMGIDPLVLPSDVPEILDPKDVYGSLKLLADRKASTSVAKLLSDPPRELDGMIWAIGADTVILHKGQAIGKSKNQREARAVLRRLTGDNHSVLTGVSVQKLELDGSGNAETSATVLEVAETRVQFRNLKPQELDWYLSTGEWMGAAGAYRIQMKGACIVNALEGSYSNVVGLPIELIYGILIGLGFSFEAG